MKKTYLTFTALVSIFSLVACGRPSTSKFFALDGVGDPDAPVPGNPLNGKWSGTIEMANWDLLYPTYVEGLFGVVLDSTLQINQSYLNATNESGLGGWDLTVIAIPQPRRLGQFDLVNCYMDPEALPLIGGDLVSTDVGEDMELDFGDQTFRSRVADYEDSQPDDLLLYFGDIQDLQTGDFLLNTYDSDVDLSWEGGVLNGFQHAPPIDRVEILHYPDELVVTDGVTATHPTVNNTPIGASLIPIDDEYEIEWTESDVNVDLMGTEIVLTVYGPSNVGDSRDYEFLADNPFFNRIARMVCLVRDDQESFTIFQSTVDQAMVDAGEAAPFTVDELMAMALDSGKARFSSEDVNGNGTLDSRSCGGIPPVPCVEDGNDNGLIDSIYGISLMVNRRSERELELPIGGGRNGRVLATGNSVKVGKLEFAAAKFRCNNGLDDDGDGAVDMDDAGCTDETDTSELSACADRIDNDNDGSIDFVQPKLQQGQIPFTLKDPQCSSLEDNDESS